MQKVPSKGKWGSERETMQNIILLVICLLNYCRDFKKKSFLPIYPLAPLPSSCAAEFPYL